MANLSFQRVSPLPAVSAALGPGAAGAPAEPGSGLAAGLRDLARDVPLEVTVRGDCMAPRMHDGDRVLVAPAARYWPGDVVAFHTPQGRLALHRLLGYRRCAGRLAFLTRGDRCDQPDSPLTPERLLGRAAVRPTAVERVRAAGAWLVLALSAVVRRLSRLGRLQSFRRFRHFRSQGRSLPPPG
jgi:hypothetical protein